MDARGAGGNVKPGQVDAVRVVPGVVRTRVEGHAPRSFVTPIIDAVEREIEAGLAPDVFHDWERITTYETATRDTLAAWYADVPPSIPTTPARSSTPRCTPRCPHAMRPFRCARTRQKWAEAARVFTRVDAAERPPHVAESDAQLGARSKR